MASRPPKTVALSVPMTHTARPANQWQFGHDPRRGSGPAPGAPNAGRPPNAWKLECADLATRGAVAARARGILDDPDHPAWLGAWRFVAEQAFGKPTQPIDLSTEILIRDDT